MSKRVLPRSPSVEDVETHRKWTHQAIDRCFDSWREAVKQSRVEGDGYPTGLEGAGGDPASMPERLAIAAFDNGRRIDPAAGARAFLRMFHLLARVVERSDHLLAKVDPALVPLEKDTDCKSRHKSKKPALRDGWCDWCYRFALASSTVRAQRFGPPEQLVHLYDSRLERTGKGWVTESEVKDATKYLRSRAS